MRLTFIIFTLFRNNRGWVCALIILPLLFAISGHSPQPKEPWTAQQLMQPNQLVEMIRAGKPVHIYSIGPSGLVKNATLIGETSLKKNVEKLRAAVSDLPKDAPIVIYCGCCPFKNCPNIRPAFSLLNALGFSNHKLLDLPRNLKVDWIDAGYPMAN